MNREVYEAMVAEVLRNHPAATRAGVSEMLGKMWGIVEPDEEASAPPARSRLFADAPSLIAAFA